MSFQAAMAFRKRLQAFSDQSKSLPFSGDIINKMILIGKDAISLRIYLPEHTQAKSIALFIHGGGFVAGNISSHENVCRTLASRMSAVFVSVEYPLAPEVKHQKITEACYQALCWVADNAGCFNALSNKLMVVGDSAGGNLAAVCALMARDRQGPQLSCQILINPITDLVHPGIYEQYRDCYLSNEAEQTHAYVSPLYADLCGLPPAFIVLHKEDCLYEQGKQYATLLNRAGVKVIEKCFSGGHLGYHFANVDERSEEPISWLLDSLSSFLIYSTGTSTLIK